MLAFLDDQRFILSRDIPVEVAFFFGLVALLVIGVAIWGFRSRGSEGERVLVGIVRVLSVLGLGVAGYIAYKTQIQGGSFQCVGGSSGCSLVEKSKYANFLGVHMSIWGLIGYATILGASFWKGDNGRLIVWGLALFGFVVSLVLRYLELWEIHASCQWCVASAVLMTLLFIVSSIRLYGYYGIDDYDEEIAEDAGTDGSGDPAAETA